MATQKKSWEVAEIELSYKPKVKASNRPKINGSRDSCEVLRSTWDLDKMELLEQFKVLLTNRANKVLGVLEISSGGISGTVADPNLIFTAALKAGASGIILSHNHPSGNLNPSQGDLELRPKNSARGRFLKFKCLIT